MHEKVIFILSGLKRRNGFSFSLFLWRFSFTRCTRAFQTKKGTRRKNKRLFPTNKASDKGRRLAVHRLTSPPYICNLRKQPLSIFHTRKQAQAKWRTSVSSVLPLRVWLGAKQICTWATVAEHPRAPRNTRCTL